MNAALSPLFVDPKLINVVWFHHTFKKFSLHFDLLMKNTPVFQKTKQPMTNNFRALKGPHVQGSNDVKTHPHGMQHLIKEAAYRSYNHAAKPLRRYELLTVSKYRT